LQEYGAGDGRHKHQRIDPEKHVFEDCFQKEKLLIFYGGKDLEKHVFEDISQKEELLKRAGEASRPKLMKNAYLLSKGSNCMSKECCKAK